MPREIALLTNPTSGKGRGAKVARRRPWPGWPRRERACSDLQGRDADEALDLARAAVADGVEALVVIGGDGMVHLGVQARSPGPRRRSGIIPAGTGNDVARYFDLPRKDPVAAADRVIAGATRTVDLARSGDKYFATVLCAGFDAVVNERANEMTWPKGQMRYNLATLAELRTFKPLQYTLDLDGATRRLEAMLVAVGNGPSFGGGLRITEGASLDDGLLDVVIIKPMSRAGAGADLPEAVQGHPHHAPAVRAPPGPPGHRRLRRASRRTPTASGSGRCRSPWSACPGR